MSKCESVADAPPVVCEPISSILGLHLQLLKLSTLINQPMRENVARPKDMSNDDLKIMVCLADLGSATGREMSGLLAMLPMSTSRAIARLEHRGWVEPADEEEDRRKRPVRLTEEGKLAFQAIGPSMTAVAERLYSRLNRREQKQLQKLIERVLESELLEERRGRKWQQ